MKRIPLVLLCAVAGAAAADSLDLAQASLSAATPVWNTYTTVRAPERQSAGTPLIVPPQPILAGKFAVAHFGPAGVDWSGYDTLVLGVTTDAPGNLVFSIAEDDDHTAESYLVTVPLEGGDQTLSVRLEAAPAGDLAPTAMAQDGAWNPGPETDVTLVFLDYPPGFAIEALTLASSAPRKEGQ